MIFTDNFAEVRLRNVADSRGGNTLLLPGNSNTFAEEETTDEFGLMPYLQGDAGAQQRLFRNLSSSAQRL